LRHRLEGMGVVEIADLSLECRDFFARQELQKHWTCVEEEISRLAVVAFEKFFQTSQGLSHGP